MATYAGTSVTRRTYLNVEGLQNIRKGLHTAIRSAQLNTAYAIAAQAAQNAPKDTEFLAESIHVVAEDFSDYEISFNVSQERFAVAKAAGVTPKGRRLGPKSEYIFLPEIRPTNPDDVWIVVGAKHGTSIENDPKRKRPYFGPAVYANRGTYTNEIRNALDGLSVKATITKSKLLEK